MAQVSTASSALLLLNGREEPKLKRLLEIELLGTIDSARGDVEAGAEASLESVAVAGPNWLDAIAKAQHYLGSHKIERIPGSTEREMDAVENLRVIEQWIVHLQKALPKP